MYDTASIGGPISPEWTINTSLFVPVTAPTPVFRDDVRIGHFDSVGPLRLIEPTIDEDTDDILSGERTLLRVKSSPQDLTGYREYRKRRGL